MVLWLVEEIDAYASSHSSTLQVQATIRVTRNTVSTNPSLRFDPRRAHWHSTVVGLYCNAVASAGELLRNLFSHLQSKGTMSEEQFNCFSSTSPWWPTLRERKTLLHADTGMNAAGGDWDVFSKARMSLSAVPGTMLKRKDQLGARLVLSSSHLGISRICWPLNNIGTLWVLDFFSLGAGSIVFDIITDHKDWKGMRIDTYTPTDPSQRGLSRAAHHARARSRRNCLCDDLAFNEKRFLAGSEGWGSRLRTRVLAGESKFRGTSAVNAPSSSVAKTKPAELRVGTSQLQPKQNLPPGAILSK